MRKDLEIVLPELAQIRTKLAVLSSLDPDLISVNEDDYIEHSKELIYGVVKIAKEINVDIIAITQQIEYILKTKASQI